MLEEADDLYGLPLDEFTAAAPPHPGAAGTGETSFGDADAPPAAEHADQVEHDLEDLVARAKEADIDGVSKMTKDELVEALTAS